MVLNKKGFLFTGIAILLLSLFLASYTFYEDVQERKSIKKRIETMNSFLFSIEEDLERQLYVAGFRSIFIMEKEIIETGSYVDNINARTEELFFNGTYNNNYQEIMEGVTFSDIENSINLKAQKISSSINLSNPKISISQSDPWNVRFSLNLSLLFQDKAGLASWNKTLEIVSFVPVEGFEDPLYTIKTNGLVISNITKSNFSQFASGNDVSNLSVHSTNMYYISHNDAPSFLDKLEGNLAADSNGIESLVNLQKLSQQGLSISTKSVVDYIYFSSNNPAYSSINGMPSWFKLDSSHLSVYNVSHLAS